MTSPISAANAYASVSRIVGSAAEAAPQSMALGLEDMTSSSKAGGFGDMLERSIADFAAQGRAGDAQAMQAISGKGDVVDVVTAVAESELALDTLVSVRDKVIAAYEEIMRMPI